MGRATQSTQTTGGSPFTFSYRYNLSSELEWMQYPSGRQVATCYDAAARPAQVQNFATQTNYVSGVQYAPQGAVSQINYHNGAVQTTSYNSRLEPLSIGLTLGGANVLALGYDYGSGTPAANGGLSSNVGNVLTATIQPNGAATTSQTFQYDPLDRLTLAIENPAATPAQGSPCPAGGGAIWCEQYGYNDAWGNRKLAGNTNSPESAPSGFDSSNHNTPNTACTLSDPGSGWRYDCAGNVIRDAANGTYAFNAEGRMTAYCPNVSAPGQCTAQWAWGQAVYTYDGAGRRVQKHAADGTVTTFVYDAQGELAAEYGGAATAAGTQYLSADALGSTRVLMNGTCVIKRLDYLPFGALAPTPASAERQGVMDCGVATYGGEPDLSVEFTGKERDAESGLDFFEARYYSSAQGRFTSPDEFKGGFLDAFTGQAVFQPGPLPYADLTDPQTLNKYAYVRNNPLRYTDPNGHCIWDLCIGEGAAVYAAGAATVTAAAYLMTPQGKESARAAIEGLGLLINKAADGIRDLVSPPPSTPADTQIQTSQDASTLQPGPHAGDSIPARGPQRDFTPGERGQVNDIGNTTGCHTCGTTTPGTKGGNFVPDHQPPSAVNTNNAPQRLYPQCLNCSRQQGGEVRQTQRTQPPPPPRPVKKPEDGSN